MSKHKQGEGGEFHSESPLAPAIEPVYTEPDQGVEAPDDPEGYVGEDGKAAPHEQPWEVREHYDEGLDELDQER